MGFSVAVQGVLQGLRKVYGPLIISAIRSLVAVLPLAYLFVLTDNPTETLWWAFPIAEVVAAVVAAVLLCMALKHLSKGNME